MKKYMERFLIAVALSFASSAAFAQVQVKDAWVRATVPQQTATGAFMQLTSPTYARLVSASSPVAGVVELHEMTMDKDVMKMRAVPGIDIPAGKGAQLKPGGYHVMMMNLKAQMKEGDVVPITLVIEGADGKRQTLEVKALVRPLKASGGDMGGMHMH
jgi:copper(I)-binding protein